MSIVLDAAQHGAGFLIPFGNSNSPTQRKVVSCCGVGQSEASAMTRKVTLEFVIPTVLSIAIAIVLSIGAVYLTNIYLGPIDQVEANYFAVGNR
jgi:hypothetical protein